MYADDSNLNFSGSTTIIEYIAQLGGGIYSDNNTLNIETHNLIEGNVATHYGGGIYVRRSPVNLPGKTLLSPIQPQKEGEYVPQLTAHLT